MHTEKNVAVLVSGGGTNLQALLDAARRGETPHAVPRLVVSSAAGAFALERARAAGLQTRVLSPRDFSPHGKLPPGRQPSGNFDTGAYSRALLDLLRAQSIDVVVLAGFLVIIGQPLLDAYRGRILNVHPSLLPSFGGRGFYGLRVHKAALERGVLVSGATVHLVNEEPDGGAILAQQTVAVRADDTPETLQERVMREAEWRILPRALESVCAKLAGAR